VSRVLVSLLSLRRIATSSLVFSRNVLPHLLRELGEDAVVIGDDVARDVLPEGADFERHAIPDSRIPKLLATRTLLPRAVRRSGARAVYLVEGPLIGARVEVPVVATLHSVMHWSRPGDMWLPRRLYWQLWYARAARRDALRCAAILPPTRACAREVPLHVPGIEPSRVRAVHHGVAPAFRPSAGPVPARTPAVLLVGNDMAYKNVAGALSIFAVAARGLPHELRLAGLDDAAVRRLADRSGIGEDVRARLVPLGKVGEAALAAEYRSASALLFPSLVESFGMPLLEAMASGCPVVASDLESLREVSGGAALHAPPSDLAAFAESLRRVLTEPAVAAAVRARGLERARHFTWEATAREIAGVLREVA
jgi:glycosyltransferase involved in cell wall biosynthesis